MRQLTMRRAASTTLRPPRHASPERTPLKRSAPRVAVALLESAARACLIVGLIVNFTPMLLSNLTTYSAYTIAGGSMEPTFERGTTLIVNTNVPDTAIPAGTIVTFLTGLDTPPTTHRVLSSQPKDGSFVYTTKGDANDSADPTPVDHVNIAGIAVLDLNHATVLPLGHFLTWTHTLFARLLMFTPAIAFLTYGELRLLFRKDDVQNPSV